jgi:uncharacterized SAM-binding protein YcdF (DUF218 family)
MIPLSTRLAVSRFLDPTVLLLVALGVALFFAFRGARAAGRRDRAARAAAWMAWGALWVLSTPLAANALIAWTETSGPDLGDALAGKDPGRAAMVVLAGGLRAASRQVPPRERLDGASTARVLGAARLWHAHPLGVVILSGAPRAISLSMMDLITTLGVPADRVVLESASNNTRENAVESARILRERGVETVVLVTSATHMRRAVKGFARAGVQVIPAPVDVLGPTVWELDQLLPSAHALSRTQVALHEILGYVRG